MASLATGIDFHKFAINDDSDKQLKLDVSRAARVVETINLRSAVAWSRNQFGHPSLALDVRGLPITD
jgi:hypothetical protein